MVPALSRAPAPARWALRCLGSTQPETAPQSCSSAARARGGEGGGGAKGRRPEGVLEGKGRARAHTAEQSRPHPPPPPPPPPPSAFWSTAVLACNPYRTSGASGGGRVRAASPWVTSTSEQFFSVAARVHVAHEVVFENGHAACVRCKGWARDVSGSTGDACTGLPAVQSGVQLDWWWTGGGLGPWTGGKPSDVHQPQLSNQGTSSTRSGSVQTQPMRRPSTLRTARTRQRQQPQPTAVLSCDPPPPPTTPPMPCSPVYRSYTSAPLSPWGEAIKESSVAQALQLLALLALRVLHSRAAKKLVRDRQAVLACSRGLFLQHWWRGWG